MLCSKMQDIIPIRIYHSRIATTLQQNACNFRKVSFGSVMKGSLVHFIDSVYICSSERQISNNEIVSSFNSQVQWAIFFAILNIKFLTLWQINWTWIKADAKGLNEPGSLPLFVELYVFWDQRASFLSRDRFFGKKCNFHLYYRKQLLVDGRFTNS